VQCFMAVLEGYAEHVMDVTGAEILDDLPGLRVAMQRRRRDRSGLLRLVDRLFGMDLKMRQYEQGKAFCDGVVARGGIAGLNRVWSGPDALPTVPELDDPARWLARTEPRELRHSA
jgi:putative hydrolase